MSGNGSIVNPWDLQTALTSAIVRPGDTLYLRGGTYAGDFISSLYGTSLKPVIVRPYADEIPIIDGSLSINGAYTQWHDFIYTYSAWPKRTTELPGNADDIPYLKSVTINAAHTKFYNNIMHDLAGFYADYPAEGSEIYGNLMYNFGWSGPDRGHDHGLYAQNIGAKVTVENNITFQHFATGLKFWGSEGHCDNYDVIGNTAFNNGILYDRGVGSAGAHVNWNLLAGSWTPTSVGFSWIDNMAYHSVDETGANDTNNICSGDGAGHGGLNSPVITGNYLAGRLADFSGTNVGPIVTPTVTGNTFIGGASRWEGYAGNTFANWPGTANAVFVNPNKYKTTRANVTVYNWEGSDNVAVDLSAVTGLAIGDSVSVRNVQDYFVDIQTLTLDASKQITVNVQAVNRTVAAPILWDAPVSTFPTFGCFVVEKA
jgi:hypothetical protein